MMNKKNHGHRHGNGVRAIDCAEAMRQLFDYLDGEVDATAHDEIHRHLEGCRSCFSRAEFEQALKDRVAGAARTAVPDGLRRRLDSLLQGFAATATVALPGGKRTHLARRGRSKSED